MRNLFSRARDKIVSVANRVKNRVTGSRNLALPSPHMVGGGH